MKAFIFNLTELIQLQGKEKAKLSLSFFFYCVKEYCTLTQILEIEEKVFYYKDNLLVNPNNTNKTRKIAFDHQKLNCHWEILAKQCLMDTYVDLHGMNDDSLFIHYYKEHKSILQKIYFLFKNMTQETVFIFDKKIILTDGESKTFIINPGSTTFSEMIQQFYCISTSFFKKDQRIIDRCITIEENTNLGDFRCYFYFI